MKFLILRICYPTLYKEIREYACKLAYETIGFYPKEFLQQILWKEQFGRIMRIRNASAPEWMKDYFIKKIQMRVDKEFRKNIRIVEPMRIAMVNKNKFYGIS